MQDRRLKLVELVGDRLDGDRVVTLGRRFLHEHADCGARDHPPPGLQLLHCFLSGPERHAVLLGESAVTGKAGADFEHTSPDVRLDRLLRDDALLRRSLH